MQFHVKLFEINFVDSQLPQQIEKLNRLEKVLKSKITAASAICNIPGNFKCHEQCSASSYGQQWFDFR